MTRDQLIQLLEAHGESYDGDCYMHFGCRCDQVPAEYGISHYDDIEARWREHMADLILAAL